MSWNIWFVPTSVMHVNRFKTVFEAFRQRGDEIRFFCVDSALPAGWATESQIRQSGYPYEMLPPNVLDPNVHWLWLPIQRRRMVWAGKCDL